MPSNKRNPANCAFKPQVEIWPSSVASGPPLCYIWDLKRIKKGKFTFFNLKETHHGVIKCVLMLPQVKEALIIRLVRFTHLVMIYPTIFG